MTNSLLVFYIDYPFEKILGKWFQYGCRSDKNLPRKFKEN